MRDDQAGGLRRLFGAAPRLTLAVEGSETTGLAVELAVAFARLGRRAVLLDRTCDAARVLDLRVRYELAHVHAGDRTAADVLLRSPDGMMLLPAARALAAMDAGDVDLDATLERVLASQRCDVVVCNGTAPARCADSQVLLALTPTPAGITATYARIKVIARRDPHRGYPVLVHRAGDDAAGIAAFASMAQTARRFLGVHLELLGAIPDGLLQPDCKAQPASPRSARGLAALRAAETLAARNQTPTALAVNH